MGSKDQYGICEAHFFSNERGTQFGGMLKYCFGSLLGLSLIQTNVAPVTAAPSTRIWASRLFDFGVEAITR